MPKLYKKIKFHMDSKVFNTVNKNFKNLYKTFESLPYFKSKRNTYFPEIKTMNNIYDKFMKAPDFKLSVSDNLVPFKFQSEDGLTLSGIKYISDPKSNKWIISLHWFAGHKYWALYSARIFIELGYNIMCFDFRNHGESDSSKYVTMGLNEVRDFRAAIKWLDDNHHPESIGLLGFSMGGFILNYGINLYYDEFSKYNIKFAITDSFYGSISTLLSHTRNIWLKGIVGQKKNKRLIKDIISTQNKITGEDWNNLNAFKHYDQDKLTNIFPILYSHSRNDKVAPFDDSLKIFTKRLSHSTDDEILIYDYSKHCLVFKFHHDQTIYRWLMFENKIMKDNKATKKALDYFGITEEKIKNNFNENLEINTFYFNSTNANKNLQIKKGKIK